MSSKPSSDKRNRRPESKGSKKNSKSRRKKRHEDTISQNSYASSATLSDTERDRMERDNIDLDFELTQHGKPLEPQVHKGEVISDGEDASSSILTTSGVVVPVSNRKARETPTAQERELIRATTPSSSVMGLSPPGSPEVPVSPEPDPTPRIKQNGVKKEKPAAAQPQAEKTENKKPKNGFKQKLAKIPKDWDAIRRRTGSPSPNSESKSESASTEGASTPNVKTPEKEKPTNNTTKSGLKKIPEEIRGIRPKATSPTTGKPDGENGVPHIDDPNVQVPKIDDRERVASPTRAGLRKIPSELRAFRTGAASPKPSADPEPLDGDVALQPQERVASPTRSGLSKIPQELRGLRERATSPNGKAPPTKNNAKTNSDVTVDDNQIDENNNSSERMVSPTRSGLKKIPQELRDLRKRTVSPTDDKARKPDDLKLEKDDKTAVVEEQVAAKTNNDANNNEIPKSEMNPIKRELAKVQNDLKGIKEQAKRKRVSEPESSDLQPDYPDADAISYASSATLSDTELSRLERDNEIISFELKHIGEPIPPEQLTEGLDPDLINDIDDTATSIGGISSIGGFGSSASRLPPIQERPEDLKQNDKGPINSNESTKPFQNGSNITTEAAPNGKVPPIIIELQSPHNRANSLPMRGKSPIQKKSTLDDPQGGSLTRGIVMVHHPKYRDAGDPVVVHQMPTLEKNNNGPIRPDNKFIPNSTTKSKTTMVGTEPVVTKEQDKEIKSDLSPVVHVAVDESTQPTGIENGEIQSKVEKGFEPMKEAPNADLLVEDEIYSVPQKRESRKAVSFKSATDTVLAIRPQEKRQGVIPKAESLAVSGRQSSDPRMDIIDLDSPDSRPSEGSMPIFKERLPKSFTVLSVLAVNLLCVTMLSYQSSFVNISGRMLQNLVVMSKDATPNPRSKRAAVFELLNGSATNIHDFVPETSGFTRIQAVCLFGFYVSVFSFCQIFGSITAVPMANKIGRKWTLFVIQSGLVIIGSLLQALSYFAPLNGVFAMLIVGRAISGFAAGIGYTVAPLYVMECSPSQWRGCFGCLFSTFIGLGQTLGALFSLPHILGTSDLFPVLLAIPAFFALFQLFLTPFINPESPKFIYNEKNDPVASEQVLELFYQPRESYQSVMKSFEKEQEIAKTFRGVSFMSLFKRQELRSGLLVALACAIGQASTGGITMISYSGLVIVKAFENSNTTDLSDSQKMAVNLSVLGLAIFSMILRSFMCFILIKHFGRRLLNSIGLLGCTAVIIVIFFLALGQQYSADFKPAIGFVIIGVLAIHTVFFSWGPGAIGMFIGTELTPFNTRSDVVTICAVANGIAVTFINLLFPILQEVIGAWTYLVLFIVPCGLLTIYLLFKQPETRNRSVVEIIKQWKDPKHAFKYHGTNMDLTIERPLTSQDPLLLCNRTTVLANPTTEFTSPLAADLWVYNAVVYGDDPGSHYGTNGLKLEPVITPDTALHRRKLAPVEDEGDNNGPRYGAGHVNLGFDKSEI